MKELINKTRVKLHSGETEGGMEMIQVAFSIAIAVALGLIVFLVINGTVAPGMGQVENQSANLFNNVANMQQSMHK